MDSLVNKPATNVRQLVIVFLMGIIVCAGGFYAWHQQTTRNAFPSSAGGTRVDVTVLREAMDKNNELSTATYLYTNSMTVADANHLRVPGVADIEMPFTEAAYILEYDGTVKAGYDLNDAEVDSPDGQRIVVTLPPVKILTHETENVRRAWEMQNICNPLHASEESGWIESKKPEMETRAIDRGLFAETEKNAKTTFEALFSQAIPDGAELEIRFATEGGAQ